MRFIIIFIFLFSSAIAGEVPNLKNIVINEKLKKYDELTFLDVDNNQIYLKNYKGNLILLNFWATWCAPCIEEMPSLDRLKTNPIFNNLEIIPINVGKDNIEKTKDFYKKLKIKDLKIYFDKDVELAKKFLLRGLPTTVFVNKKGEEFARVIGFVNFDDKNIIKWLKKYD